MIGLEKLQSEWEKDCQIDETHLDTTSIENAKLHAKYLKHFSDTRLKIRMLEKERENLFKDKWLYYTGKMTKKQMDERGWVYDPFDGASKPMKADMKHFIEADEHISKLRDTLEYYETIREALINILDTIKWRHQTIKNIIEHRKFINGA